MNHPQAIHLLGLVEKGAGDDPLASQRLARSAELDPENPEIPNNQGLLARLTGEFDIAETAFRRALQLKPDFRSARLSLGRTLSDLERFDEAMKELRRLVQQNAGEMDAAKSRHCGLFPSFLWHGTELVRDGSVRVTAPFDVVPA